MQKLRLSLRRPQKPMLYLVMLTNVVSMISLAMRHLKMVEPEPADSAVDLISVIWATSLVIFLATSLVEQEEVEPEIMDHAVVRTFRHLLKSNLKRHVLALRRRLT